MNASNQAAKYMLIVSYASNTIIWLIFFGLLSYGIQILLMSDKSVFEIFIIIQIIYTILWVIKWIPNIIYYKLIGKKLAIDAMVNFFESLKMPNRLYKYDDVYRYLDRLISADGNNYFGDEDPYKFIEKNEHARIKQIAIELQLMLRIHGEQGDNILANMRYVDNFKSAYDIVFSASKAHF